MRVYDLHVIEGFGASSRISHNLSIASSPPVSTSFGVFQALHQTSRSCAFQDFVTEHLLGSTIATFPVERVARVFAEVFSTAIERTNVELSNAS
jgi:hypothetical protein